MRYEFMAMHTGEHGVKRMCQALGVTRSGYYAWRSRPAGPREQSNQQLVAQIKKIHQSSRQTYGSPRIHAALRRMGIVCGRHRVARLMRLHGIAARKPRKRFYDNAVMESFLGTLKNECVTGQFATRAQARTTIFEYIEVWYNRQRLHSSLGYCSPAEFEQRFGH